MYYLNIKNAIIDLDRFSAIILDDKEGYLKTPTETPFIIEFIREIPADIVYQEFLHSFFELMAQEESFGYGDVLDNIRNRRIAAKLKEETVSIMRGGNTEIGY